MWKTSEHKFIYNQMFTYVIMRFLEHSQEKPANCFHILKLFSLLWSNLVFVYLL